MKNQAQFIRFSVGTMIVMLFFFTRFVNLSWSLPYPMHPDERNMAVAIELLSCDPSLYTDQRRLDTGGTDSFVYTLIDTVRFAIRDAVADCLHPNFFAYGQFPLYLAYGGILVVKILTGSFASPVTFPEAALALRVISAVASLGAAFFIIEIVRFIAADLFNPSSKRKSDHQQEASDHQKQYKTLSLYIILIPVLFTLFNPGLIQFSHFGTTESLLMFLYVGLVFFSVRLFQKRISVQEYLFVTSVFSGLALATKLTGLTFLAIPGVTLIQHYLFAFKQIKKPYLIVGFLAAILIFAVVTVFVAILLSPYNVLAYDDYLASMRYESDVAFGSYVAFYTRQFEQTIPVVFQAIYTLPFAFGVVPFILFLIGFFILPWHRKEINLLRFALLIYAIPQLLLFAKWSRFLAPVFPIMILLISLTAVMLVSFSLRLLKRYEKRIIQTVSIPQKMLYPAHAVIIFFLVFLSVLPGVAYLSVYLSRDVRFEASQWIYENVPEGSYILSETANVVDIPIQDPATETVSRNYPYRSFNFYDIDLNRGLHLELQQEISRADYIFVPSRRVFANHTCLRPDDYQTSFLADLSQATFPSYHDSICAYRERAYPKLNQYYEDLFSGELGFEHVATFSSYPRIGPFLRFPDEDAEETWTVFDHPVIRIYKKTDL